MNDSQGEELAVFRQPSELLVNLQVGDIYSHEACTAKALFVKGLLHDLLSSLHGTLQLIFMSKWTEA